MNDTLPGVSNQVPVAPVGIDTALRSAAQSLGSVCDLLLEATGVLIRPLVDYSVHEDVDPEVVSLYSSYEW